MRDSVVDYFHLLHVGWTPGHARHAISRILLVPSTIFSDWNISLAAMARRMERPAWRAPGVGSGGSDAISGALWTTLDETPSQVDDDDADVVDDPAAGGLPE